MNKSDFERLGFLLCLKLGITGGYIEKIDNHGVFFYLTWGAIKKIQSSEQKASDET